MHPALPYTLGHENAGWLHETGPAVTNVAVGDTVILLRDRRSRWRGQARTP